jgi:uncharacterized protein (TIGR02996 family)
MPPIRRDVVVRDIIERHSVPEHRDLEGARAIVRGIRVARSAWEALSRAGFALPGERLFRVTGRQLATSGCVPEELRTVNTNGFGRTPRTLALPYPGSVEAAVAFATARRLPEAEAAARTFLERIAPFRFLAGRPPPPGARTPVWRVSGSPIDRDDAGPTVCDVEGAGELLDLLFRLTKGQPRPFPHVNRARAACVHANACELWAHALPIPPQIRIGSRTIATPRGMIRRRPETFANPFEPLVEIWRLGFGVRRLSSETILLTLPQLGGFESSASARRPRRSAKRLDEQRLLDVAHAGRAAETVALLDQGIDPNAEVDGRTPLHHAVLGGHRTQSATLGALLDAGADPDRVDGSMNTPLSLAVAGDHVLMARSMLGLGFDRDRLLPGGRNLLHVAAHHGARRVAEALIDLGVPIGSTCAAGRTPLHYAVAGRRRDMAETLLERGADPNAQDHFGRTPLHASVIAGAHADLLIGRGALRIADRYGFMPEDLGPFDEPLPPAGASKPLVPLPLLPENPGLEGAIRSWEDEEAWAVYADWLGTRGDPRSELIHLDLTMRRTRGRERDRLEREEQGLRLDARIALFGEIQRFLHLLVDPGRAREAHVASPDGRERLVMRRGFPYAIAVDDPIALAGILDMRCARFLRRLEIPATVPILRALAARVPPALEVLRLGRPAATEAPIELPRIPILDVPAASLLSAVALPDLERLHVRAFEGERGAASDFAARAPETLAHLAYRGPASVLDELLAASVADRLETLRVVRADRDVVALLIARAPRMRRLRHVRVYAFGASVEDRAALRRRLREIAPHVRVP